MAIAPGAFFDAIGPFGTRNDHYLRDLSTFYIALGAAGLVAVRRPGWRVPVLALATIEFALHAINHLADIGKSDPGWNGPADFAAVAASAVLLAWMTRVAARDDG
jgi:PPE-repeat protein